jgi:hypothetical protein
MKRSKLIHNTNKWLLHFQEIYTHYNYKFEDPQICTLNAWRIFCI